VCFYHARVASVLRSFQGVKWVLVDVTCMDGQKFNKVTELFQFVTFCRFELWPLLEQA